MNKQGQAFSAYKLLIGAIMGLAILVIIVATINYFEGQKEDIDWRIITDGFKAAVNSPNGEVLVKKDVTVRAGRNLNSRGFSEIVSIEEECIFFDARDGKGFVLGEDNKSLYAETAVKTNIYYRCALHGLDPNLSGIGPSCPSTCGQCCIISFGKKPDPIE